MMSASKALSPEQDRPVTLLAMFLALVISLVLTFCVPIWASISIALAAVVLVAMGGGVLLAKGFITAAAVAVVIWLLRDLRRKRLERTANVKWMAIPELKDRAEVKEAEAETRPRPPERLAA
jgi:membrane protein implicated in regulation of membrane protease activity